MSDEPMTRVESRSDFVAGTAGFLFRTCSWPVAEGHRAFESTGAMGTGLPAILFVAPIGEEMNRSRRFLATLRRECARRGARTVLVDPFGTGDSAGEFVEATWEVWVDDLVAAAETLVEEVGEETLTLLGVRSGCLLVDALARRLDPMPAHIAEIQPESDGGAVVRRLLSTRVLAERFAGRRGESVERLERCILMGESLELGGYEVGAALLRALRKVVIDPSAAPRATGRSHRFDLTESVPTSSSDVDGSPVPGEVDVFDVSDSPGGPASVDGASSSWRHHRLPTRPFWQLTESAPDPHVVARIAEVLVP